jgi:hypothetical protein
VGRLSGQRRAAHKGEYPRGVNGAGEARTVGFESSLKLFPMRLSRCFGWWLRASNKRKEEEGVEVGVFIGEGYVGRGLGFGGDASIGRQREKPCSSGSLAGGW